ncbi:hypothetical protein G6011_05843 [Alternaria panax]|uniref:Uncharacterized protein n=1 Tax=Alternaria panax TaxID=48097 RepID=A0AAD4FGI7_9PLEO|nr:hypothetical protein G6011_05843 [Alternaria panax]
MLSPSLVPMPIGTPSMVEECTNATTKAALYLSRLGLEKNFKDPNKPGRPNFKSVSALKKLRVATVDEVKAIVALYDSRKAIREALECGNICLDEIAKECLKNRGHKIWTDGIKTRFLLSLDASTTPPKVKGHAQVAGDKYLRHLIYEHPSDERKIRLQVSAWIVQRACRKAEDDRREGKTPQKARMKASKDASSFMKAVLMKPDKRTCTVPSVSDDSFDEINFFEKPVDRSVGSNRNARRIQPQTSRKGHDIHGIRAKRRRKQTVAVVIPARKPQNTKPTGITSRKQERDEPLSKRDVMPPSTKKKREDMSGDTPQFPTPCRTTPRHTRTGTHSEQSVQDSANTNLESLVRQLDEDRSNLSIDLTDLLSPHDPGCHDLAAIKQAIGIIDTIALNDAESLRKSLGDSYNRQTIALDRWLGCIKTLVEFRECTGLAGNAGEIEKSFPKLPLPIKKRARFLRQRKRQEIVRWFKKPASKALEFTIPNFSEDVASVLLKMTSWDGLQGMDLDELLEDMVPFTKRLLEWFRAIPTTSVDYDGRV